MKAAPIRHTKYAWWHYDPNGYAPAGGLKSYDEYLLWCGHRLLLPPSRKVRWTHRCQECVKAIDSQTKGKQ